MTQEVSHIRALLLAACVAGLVCGAAFLSGRHHSPAAAVETPDAELHGPEPDAYMSYPYRISPYDSLIRVYSDSAGLDWRFVSAIISYESNFRHNARSRRGAEGLMQMMPGTARAFGADSLLDAAQSVKAGTLYLQSLWKRYRGVAANTTERQKLTLAAYNAGEGRIADCINFARHKGVDPGHWDNIVALIPEMREESILEVDTVKLGTFQGYETILYVSRVMGRYAQYRKKVPDHINNPVM